MDPLKTNKMKKVIIILNIIPWLSTLMVYAYILIFYMTFKKLAPLDPKDLSPFLCQSITYLYGISILLTFPVLLLVVVNFILKFWSKDFIKNNKLILWTIISYAFFWIIILLKDYYSFWFFD